MKGNIWLQKRKICDFAENRNGFLAKIAVAPLAGAWIEINVSRAVLSLTLSLPLRERRLKYGRISSHTGSHLFPLPNILCHIINKSPTRFFPEQFFIISICSSDTANKK